MFARRPRAHSNDGSTHRRGCARASPRPREVDGIDALRLGAGAEALAALVRRHPDVERVLCGHTHRPIRTRGAGTLASVAPSAAHQTTLDLEPEAPLPTAFDPPALALHR